MVGCGTIHWQSGLVEALATPAATLSADEQAFLQGPVEELCGMLDDWRINWESATSPRRSGILSRQTTFSE